MRRSLIRASRYRNIVYLVVLNKQASRVCSEAGIKMSQHEHTGHGVSKRLGLMPRHILRSVCFYFSSLRRPETDAECMFEFSLEEMNTSAHLHWPAQPEMLFGSHVSGLFPFRFKCFWCFNKRGFLLAPSKPTQVSALGSWLCLDLNVTLSLGTVFFSILNIPTDRVSCTVLKLERGHTCINVSFSKV